MPADAAAFLKEMGGFMATRDAANRPTAVESMMLELDPESGVGEIAAAVRYARNTVDNLRDNGRFALVISKVWGDHRSVQVKGRCLDVRGPVQDPERIAPRTEELARMLTTFGLPARVAEDYRSIRYDLYYLVRVQVDEVFDQTPGPGAGRLVS